MAAMVLSADAATVLIDEDFNNPLAGATNNTNLRDNPGNFPGWNFNDTAGLSPQYKVGPTDGAPVSAGDGFVKFDSFGNSGADPAYTMQFDTGHTWSSTDQFTLTINATEQSWNSANDRFMRINIRETARSGVDLSGDVLWTSGAQALVLDPNHDSAGEGWGPNNSFSFTFNAADFVSGTEGTAISFELRGEGSRGYHFDNVYMEVSAIPEPSALALMGLGGLALSLRRRR